jgi:hypothetical protein
MKTISLVTLTALASLTGPLPLARSEHAAIDLRVARVHPQTGKVLKEVTAGADREPPTGGRNQRPLFKVKAGEPLVVQFILTNKYPHGVRKDVVVRYFVVREGKARQKTRPVLTTGVVTQGRFHMNFKPKSRVGARVRFTITRRGVYLVRVETEHTASDHEHFAAIDLQVELPRRH